MKNSDLGQTITVKILVMDVDGTLTDGKVYMGASGEMMKAFDIKDGYGLANILPKHKIIPVIITGRKSEILSKRCEELKIEHVYQGISDKICMLEKVVDELQISFENVAYIGDDLNDLECMQMCGLTACPADAVEEIKAIVDFQCKKNGGSGAVREFLEWICSKANE